MDANGRRGSRAGRFGAARPRPGELPAPEFGRLVSDHLVRALPPELAHGQVRRRHRLVQLHYGDPAVHYEVWVHGGSGRIEVGLHFEGERERNARWLAALDDRLIEIKALAGHEFELEPWDRGWCRLYRTFPAEPLTPALAERVARSLGMLVTTLQPILAEEEAHA